MSNSGTIEGLRDILRHFGEPASHTDGDALHISIDELKDARGTISTSADHLIDSMAAEPSNYDALRAIQREGWFNDRQVSMQDLRAAVRGTGENGGDVSRARETLFSKLAQTSRQQKWRSKWANDVASVTGLRRMNDNGEGILGYAAAVTGKSVQQINALGAQVQDSWWNGGSLLTFAAALSDLSVAEINQMHGESRARAYNGDAMLTLGAAVSQQPMSELNDRFEKADRSSYNGEAILALASVLSGRPIDEVNALHDGAAKSDYNGEAILVLAAVLCGKSMQEVNAMHASAARSDDNGEAILVLAAAVSGKTISDVNRIHERAASSDHNGEAIVTLASALTDLPVEELNVLQAMIPTGEYDYNAESLIVLGLALKRANHSFTPAVLTGLLIACESRKGWGYSPPEF